MKHFEGVAFSQIHQLSSHILLLIYICKEEELSERQQALVFTLRRVH